jgi:hypothetical protein
VLKKEVKKVGSDLKKEMYNINKKFVTLDNCLPLITVLFFIVVQDLLIA